LAEFLADGSARDGEDAAEIGLHEDADGVSTEIGREVARGGADAAFPAEGDRSGACADSAFFYGSWLSVFYSGEDVVRCDVAAANVAEVSVIGFADNRIDGQHIFVTGKGEHVGDQGVRYERDAGGGSQEDGRFDIAEFLYLRGAREFSETVADEYGAGDFFAIEIAGVRQNGSHAGADVVSADYGGVSDFYAGNVGDGVKRAGREDADLQAQV
jgi:hypothetical protein